MGLGRPRPGVGRRADASAAGYSLPRRSGVVPRCGPASTSMYWRSSRCDSPLDLARGGDRTRGTCETSASASARSYARGGHDTAFGGSEIVPAISVDDPIRVVLRAAPGRGGRARRIGKGGRCSATRSPGCGEPRMDPAGDGEPILRCSVVRRRTSARHATYWTAMRLQYRDCISFCSA